MRPRTASRLLKLYPKRWRDRFGPEFLDLLEAEQGGSALLFDLLRATAAERLFDVSGLERLPMQTYPASVLSMAKRPSGFVPLAMSLCALGIVVMTVWMFGAVHRSDEAAGAHVFQLLVAGELPVIAFFAIRWLRKDLKASLTMLTIHTFALALAFAPVWYFGL